MSWRDRAIPADKPAGGSWRDRAIAAEPAAEQDILENAARDVSDLAGGIGALAKKGAKMLFVEPYQTGRALAEGKPLSDTPLGESARGAAEIAKSIPGALFERGKEIVTDPVGAFKEHPVNTTLDVLGVAFPAAKAAGLSKAGVKAAARAATQAAAEPVAGALESVGQAAGRRSLGMTKRFLNTPEKIAQANQDVDLALKRGIITPKASAEEMAARIEALREKAGQGIGDFLTEQNLGAKRALKPKAAPQLREQFLFDPQTAMADLEKLRPKFRGGEYDDIHRLVDSAQETIKAHGTRPIPWTEANELKGMLQDMANWDTTKSKAFNNTKKAIAGRFRQYLDTSLEQAVKARGGEITPFLENKRLYGAAERMGGAMANRLSSEMGNKAIGLTDWLSGVAGGTVGGVPGAVTGMAAKKTAETYGSQATAVYAIKLAEKVRKAPQVFGEYAPVLLEAAERGDQSLAVTNFLLQQKDPAYRRLLEGLEGGLRLPGFTH
jgi:hypothetical protein